MLHQEFRNDLAISIVSRETSNNSCIGIGAGSPDITLFTNAETHSFWPLIF